MGAVILSAVKALPFRFFPTVTEKRRADDGEPMMASRKGRAERSEPKGTSRKERAEKGELKTA